MPAQPSNDWSVQVLNADGTNNGTPKTLAALGIESATYDLNNMAADTLTFTVGGKALDAATLWSYGTLLAVLKPDGTRFFVGRVEPWTRDGRPDSQNHLGRLVNPWWYLEHKIYEQTYIRTVFNTLPAVGSEWVPSGTVTYTTPRVVLNVLYDGGPGGRGFYAATTGQQLADAVNWAIAAGAPIKLGVTDPATLPFSDFQKGIFCADVIKLQFRKEPDFVVDWDYITLPFPTIHFRKPASLAPLTIDLRDATAREAVSIKERPDWQRSYVKINYDQTNSYNGEQFLATYADWYSALGQGNYGNGAATSEITGVGLPDDPESKFRGVDLFCDLTGYTANVNTTYAEANFASQPFDINSLVCWQNWQPSLVPEVDPKKGIVKTVTLEDGTDPNYPAPVLTLVDEFNDDGSPATVDASCLHELVDGEWAQWINNSNAQRVRAVCYHTTENRNKQKETKLANHDFTAVNINTGGVSKKFINKSTNAAGYQYAEAIPEGLAKAMWTSWQNLAIEGSFTDVAAVVGAHQNISRANSLNFLTATPGVAGAPDWRAVNALVQQISGDIAKGANRVNFGAPLKITGHDLIDAIRATRYRITTIDLGYLFGGAMGGGSSGGSVPFGRKTHARHSAHGGAHTRVHVVSENPDPQPLTHACFRTDGATGISTWVEPNGPGQPAVVMDPSKAKGTDNNWHPCGLIEVKIPQVINGKCYQRTMIVFGSLSFQAPDDPPVV